jgi:hypothetical protein
VARNFVAFGDQALFIGADTADAYGLWVTDGTAAGTTEIGGAGNAAVTGKYATAWGPTNFTAAGDQVFFNATDS